MIGSKELNNEASNLINNFRGEIVGSGLQATAQAEMLREERVKNLLGILNNEWLARRMGTELQESILETLTAVAAVYNKELREDPTISQALPAKRELNDDLNSLLR